MSIITISRGTFAGGKTLARHLAARLDYRCLSREVIFDAAREYGVSAQRLTEAMEKPPSLWQQLAGERNAYLNYVRAAFCERAREGNLVYHGHAGHLLLTGVSHVIRVRVIASIDFRVESAMRRLQLTRGEALAYIEKVDRERALWTRLLYDVDWNDNSLYDVVLNLQQMSIETASEIVARMTELPYFQPTASSTQAVEDLALASRVWARLSRDPHTAAANLIVTADRGVVSISGTALGGNGVNPLALIASQVQGVREIRFAPRTDWHNTYPRTPEPVAVTA